MTTRRRIFASTMRAADSEPSEAPLCGGIEAGGTKFVCAIGSDPLHIHARARFETDQSGHPERTLQACHDWFRSEQQRLGVTISALGIGSFGPLDLARQTITTTPKPGWRNFPLGRELERLLGLPIAFDTDVNAAVLAEHRWGAGREVSSLVYVTIGTGIGGGALVAGELLHGALHPEMGHMPLQRDPADTFAGVCPYHGACWEGLCSGPALRARWGLPAEELAADHPAWPVQARYVAQALYTVACVLSPRRFVLGGSVSRAGRLGSARFLALVHAHFRAIANGYLALPELAEIERYIVSPGLGEDSGVLGCLALAERALLGERASLRRH
ncbi:MAG TPA: ROK family protein [Polyangiaceae bacterium]|jgi:fructokinase